MNFLLGLRRITKLIVVVLTLACWFLVVNKPASAGGYQFVVAKASDTIAASGSNTPSELVIHDLRGLGGYFSLQVTVTGDGTVKGEYQLSNDCVTFVEPASALDIFTDMTKTGGPGSDGIGFYSFYPEPCRCMKILFTETDDSDSVNVSGFLTVY